MEWTQPNYETSGPGFERAKAIFEGADVPTEDRTVVVSERAYFKFKHQLKMAQKKRQRLEASGRRAAAYERMKADAHRVVLKMRHWLKSPYAFRSGGMQ